MSTEIKKQIIFGIIVSSSYISNYNILHILFNALVLYVLTGLIDKINIYTFQDTIKLSVDNLSYSLNSFFKIIWNGCTLIHGYYSLIRHYIREKLRDMLFVLFGFKNDKTKKIIFDLMDTERFPSVSMYNSNMPTVKPIKINSKIEISDSVSLDDEIFNQSDDIFINGISVDENDDKHKNIEVINNAQTYSIVNDFFK